jgi:hypothetical protein
MCHLLESSASSRATVESSSDQKTELSDFGSESCRSFDSVEHFIVRPFDWVGLFGVLLFTWLPFETEMTETRALSAVRGKFWRDNSAENFGAIISRKISAR